MPQLPPILLVDDDPDDLFILRRLLAKVGVENKIVAFEDPRGAVAHLEAVVREDDTLFLPCIIFTDLQMPGMDGIEFAGWVRSQPDLAETLIVMVSSSEDPKHAERSSAVGVSRYLLKYPAASVLAGLVKTAPCG